MSEYIGIIKAAIIAAAISAVLLGVHRFMAAEQQEGYDRAVAEYTARQVIAEQSARKVEQELRKQLEDARNAATERENTIRASAAAAGAASASLRDTLASIRNGVPGATAASLANSVVALATVFEQCQGRYRGMAEIADRHASDVKTLIDAWPSAASQKALP